MDVSLHPSAQRAERRSADIATFVRAAIERNLQGREAQQAGCDVSWAVEVGPIIHEADRTLRVKVTMSVHARGVLRGQASSTLAMQQANASDHADEDAVITAGVEDLTKKLVPHLREMLDAEAESVRPRSADARSTVAREDEVWPGSRRREGATVGELCREWLRDLASLDAGPAEPGQSDQPSCRPGSSEPIAGTLPAGLTLFGTLVLRYRIGAIPCTDHAFVFRTADGKLLGGPIFRSEDDSGDGGDTLATHAFVASGSESLLVIAEVSATGLETTPGKLLFLHRARACRWAGDGYACDPVRVFEREHLSPDAARTFRSAPKTKSPPLDRDGHVRPAP